MYRGDGRPLPVAFRPASLGGIPTVALPTIGELRAKLKARMDKLRTYDLFLRDRTVIEWFKDNSAIVHWLVRDPASRARHEESHEFWTHLGEAEKRQLIGRWINLVETGARLQGDARQGGIGVGYGAHETAPPARTQALAGWLRDADDFVGQFEQTRQRMKVEARINPSTPARFLSDALRPLLWAVGLGVVGIVAFTILTRPRLPMRLP
jgi:hypothetical protein